jgi:predicted molibdopterin-dependent oxidoreductase YjgC
MFMPFHFAESAAHVLTNAAPDPIARIPEYKVCAVAVESVPADRLSATEDSTPARSVTAP